MKIFKRYAALIFLIALTMGAISVVTFAWGSEDDCRRGHQQCGHNDEGEPVNVEAQAESEAAATAESSANANSESSAIAAGGAGGEGGSATAEGGGGDASIVFGKRAPSNFLYMQNQVEACGRTFGFSGSNTSGGWAFGIPIPRSWTPTCDLWKAAEEAQQNGFVFTSYMFQCSIKAVWNVLGEDTCKKFELMSLVEMGMIEEPPDLSDIYDRAARYDERWLMADITQEDYEAQQEMIEERLEQQQTLLDQRAELIEEYDEELENLKKEQETHKQAEAEKKNAFNVLYEKLAQGDES